MHTSIPVSGSGGSPSIFDAVVDAAGNGDYADILAAWTAGHRRLFIKDGTYSYPSLTSLGVAAGETVVLEGESESGVILDNAQLVESSPYGNYHFYVGLPEVLKGTRLIDPVVPYEPGIYTPQVGDSFDLSNDVVKCFTTISAVADNGNGSFAITAERPMYHDFTGPNPIDFGLTTNNVRSITVKNLSAKVSDLLADRRILVDVKEIYNRRFENVTMLDDALLIGGSTGTTKDYCFRVTSPNSELRFGTFALIVESVFQFAPSSYTGVSRTHSVLIGCTLLLGDFTNLGQAGNVYHNCVAEGIGELTERVLAEVTIDITGQTTLDITSYPFAKFVNLISSNATETIQTIIGAPAHVFRLTAPTGATVVTLSVATGAFVPQTDPGTDIVIHGTSSYAEFENINGDVFEYSRAVYV